MFFNKTIKKFFIKDGSHDFLYFLFGLIFLFTFALLRMPQWIFCLGIGVPTSVIFRYITTDDLFYEEFQNLNTRNNKLKYMLSKNMFTLFFLLAFVFVLYFILNIGIKLGLVGANDFGFRMVFSIIIYILATENIILIFNHKVVPSYKSGYKRNYSEDVEVGMANLKSMIPSLILNVILLIIIFKFNLNLFLGVVYLLTSEFIFTSYENY